ncbi:rhodanese-like domain-containing protein [Hoeflea poritis]|uniref:Rhodanese-like domain-containing protein n=1 Tax=Hoeflea poritis TaxID=2993659 RepID=A0ABT4VVS4_9HYPH|nr:rhodanese-like domain-containing protein [Hoeflea poritis]MDA4848822.1 rhodanese-like domain-containing protein [Hoeflea poritis]
MVAEANGIVDCLTAEEALALHGNTDVLFVDLRDVRELQREGMIPGAFHCPRGMLEFWIDPESPYARQEFASGRRYVFYCASGWRSALSARTAVDMGLAEVSHIESGFTG